MIDHLRQHHGITKQDPDGVCSRASKIQKAFGNAIPKIVFNKDIFRLLLLRWIIANNISFSLVNDNTFRTLLTYLCACVSSFLPPSSFNARNSMMFIRF